MTLHELLWNASHGSLMDARDMQRFVQVRDAHGQLGPASVQEETATENLVRKLASLSGATARVTCVLHSRPLEGRGSKKASTRPSGADLELAVQVRPGRRGWLNLVLQAKRLDVSRGPVGKKGVYAGWSPKQNKNLVAWARSNNRIPGMLLFNECIPPFGDLRVSPGDFNCPRAFGACAGANRLQLRNHDRTARGGFDLFEGTPARVSLCLREPLLKVKNPRPSAIRKHHFPLEHLAHAAGCEGVARGGGSAIEENGFELGEEPPWVRALADGVIDVDPDFPVAASVVIRAAD